MNRSEPTRDCPFCPRLVAFRELQRERRPEWHNAPVRSFGPPDAELLIVGLAPGLGGANRTGRPFTGDYAGEVLYPALIKKGLAHGRFEARVDDSLVLDRCRITNAVRCVPPANKPTPAEIATCRRYLRDELLEGPRPRIVLALGRIAFESILRVYGLSPSRLGFVHCGNYKFDGLPPVVASYHCSRYNVNTGRLTPAMFDAALDVVMEKLARAV